MELNFESLQLFIKGMSTSREAHAEEPETYEYGLNGRVFSKNGKFSFSSIEGTVEIYNNPKIVKYLGYFAFADEVVFFVKYDDDTYLSTIVDKSNSIVASNISLTIPYGSTTKNIVSELTDQATLQEEANITLSPTKSPSPLEGNDLQAPTKEIDLADLFTKGTPTSGYELCSVEDTTIPDYNKTYVDAIISLKKRSNGSYSDVLRWVGMQNWDINRKINTVGVFENNYYKRVYYTDNLNTFSVVNLKDKDLFYRQAAEFATRQNAILLQPEVTEIIETGSLKAISTQYTYILISENGQRTPFSPFSPIAYIPADATDNDFAGGDIDEITDKAVIVTIPIVSLLFKDIQCIAIEYGTDGAPTALRNLGIKAVQETVEFIHTGQESEWDTSFTIEEIIDASENWSYCSDITIKNNRIIAGGLRNKPLGWVEKELQDLFYFRGYQLSGATHTELINPSPSTYQYFNPFYTSSTVLLKKRYFTSILAFGNWTLTFRNKTQPGTTKTISFVSSKDQYVDYVDDIWEWLNALQQEPDFLQEFPYLVIELINNRILFRPIDTTAVDMANYVLESSISQTIFNYDNEYVTIQHTVPSSDLIYGAQSHGFNKGIGMRISWLPKSDVILDGPGEELYTGGVLINLATPSLKKSFVKDEIYRIGLQCFKNGVSLFTIIGGDVKTPAVGDDYAHLSEGGSIVRGSGSPIEKYRNQDQIGNKFNAQRLEARIEVRLPCSVKKHIDSYQIVYVERTPQNRTVVAQGMTGPLVRQGDKGHPSESLVKYAPDIARKWCLPFNGGPLYGVNGFLVYDNSTEGESWDDIPNKYGTGADAVNRREILSRKLMYFDSPDFIQGRISSSLLKSAKVSTIGKIRPDYTGRNSRSAYPYDPPIRHSKYHVEGIYFDWGAYPETYAHNIYSRKIGYNHLPGTEDLKPFTINFSVFSLFQYYKSEKEIEKTTDMLNIGEIVPASILSTSQEYSNNALTLFGSDVYYSGTWRNGAFGTTRFYCEFHKSAKASPGYPTIFLKTETDFWTNQMLTERFDPIYIKAHIRNGLNMIWELESTVLTEKGWPCIDVHTIVNIKRDIEDTIYGGRSKYAYSTNLFLPLSKVIPLNTGSNASQIFTIEGDFYVTLFMRMKNDNSLEPDVNPHPDGTFWTMLNFPSNAAKDFTRGNGWAYAVMLETEIESRFNQHTQFYREKGIVDINSGVDEIINPAYLKKNDLRIYNPIPYNFKDDPLLVHILSASKVKLSGDYLDTWTDFLINEFYELERAKGAISNVTSWQDELYVIQEDESNKVNIDAKSFVTTQSGEEVAIKKSDGSTFTNHDKISNYGTNIRRALAEGDFGFSFIDEKRNSFIKFAQPISLATEIEFKLDELFQDDPIIDTEGYYDTLYKETNIRIRTQSGKAYCLSYNEVLKLFNGFYEYDNDLYIMFDKKVFAPIRGTKTVVIGGPSIPGSKISESVTGQWFYYEIIGDNIVSYELLDTLPSGMNFDESIGIFSGKISVAGNYDIRVRISNGTDQLIETFTFTVSDTLPVITSNCPMVKNQGEAFSYQIEASGEPEIFDVKGLPSGLNVSPTGLITGTAPAAGTYAITLYVQNTFGSATKACNIVTTNLYAFIFDSRSEDEKIEAQLIGTASLSANINGTSTSTLS